MWAGKFVGLSLITVCTSWKEKKNVFDSCNVLKFVMNPTEPEVGLYEDVTLQNHKKYCKLRAW
jgi:hypothetical protein